MIPDVDNRQAGIAGTIDSLRRDLDELKSRQLIAWDNLRTYKRFSPNLYDISVTLSEGEIQRYLITFDFSSADRGAIMEMNAFYRLINPDVMADPNPRRAPTNPQIDVKWEKTQSGTTFAEWDLIVVNTAAVPATYTAYVKLFFDGTDTGDFSIDEV